jgi:hypothetical protein
MAKIERSRAKRDDEEADAESKTTTPLRGGKRD